MTKSVVLLFVLVTICGDVTSKSIVKRSRLADVFSFLPGDDRAVARSRSRSQSGGPDVRGRPQNAVLDPDVSVLTGAVFSRVSARVQVHVRRSVGRVVVLNDLEALRCLMVLNVCICRSRTRTHCTLCSHVCCLNPFTTRIDVHVVNTYDRSMGLVPELCQV